MGLKWSEMKPEERDDLVHDKVMGWQYKPICDGRIEEQSNSPDGWCCLKCGYEGCWGDDFEHEEIPPHYSISMDAAWKLVEKLDGEFTVRLYTTELKRNVAEFWHKEEPTKSVGAFAESMPLAIVIAALKACGVEVD